MKKLSILILLLLSSLTSYADGKVKELDKEPAKQSKILHIECGANQAADTSTAWSDNLDEATLAKGYSYEVTGDVYNWAGKRGCWYNGATFEFTLKVPKGVKGKLYLYCVDYEANVRAEKISLNDDELIEINQFGPYPDSGKWIEIPITEKQSKNGQLTISIQSTGQVNAVLSIVDFQPEQP